MSSPILSIIMITYNHEQHIEQAIRSILSQKLTHYIELIISNDASSDNTDNIIKSINNTNRFITINYIEHLENLGMNQNFQHTFNQCKGKYISICEGDDYWIDENKTENQINFLEENPSFVATTSNTYYLKENKLTYTYIGSKELWLKRKIKKTIDYTDIPQRLFPHTSSWTFRNNTVAITDEMLSFPVGDMPLFMLLCNKGKVNYSTDITSAYRIHNYGAIGALKKTNPIASFKRFAEMYISVDKISKRSNSLEVNSFIINDHLRFLIDSPSLKNLKIINSSLYKLKKEQKVSFSSFLIFSILLTYFKHSFLTVLKKIKSSLTLS